MVEEVKPKSFDDLIKEVHERGICGECGGCVSFCSAHEMQAIEMPKGDNKLSIEARLEPQEGGDDGGGEASDGGDRPPSGDGHGGGHKKPPSKKKKKKDDPGDKTPSGFGYLSVSTQPWTIVYVDKKKVKNTPLMKYKLPAGKHSVTLLNNDFNIKKTYTVIIAPNQETRIIKNLTQ